MRLALAIGPFHLSSKSPLVSLLKFCFVTGRRPA